MCSIHHAPIYESYYGIQVAVRIWFIARCPPIRRQHIPGCPIKFNIADQGGRFYEPGMELPRDSWLRFNIPHHALPAYLEFKPSTPAPLVPPASEASVDTCLGPTRRSASSVSVAGHSIITALRNTSATGAMNPRGKAPVPRRPGWKGYAEVSADYIPAADKLVTETPICSSRTRSGEHSLSAPAPRRHLQRLQSIA
jgi:hypothetical protein